MGGLGRRGWTRRRWIILPVMLALVGMGFFWLLFFQNRDTGASYLPEHDYAKLLLTRYDNEAILPVPVSPLLDPRKVNLGYQLFHDKTLSHDKSVACVSCHDLSQGGTTHTAYSTGIHQQIGTVNAPTVFNSGLNFRYFWDGRAATLENQVDGPLQNPIEMGATWPEVVRRLRQRQDMVKQFDELYGDITPEAIRQAIATFERSLNTPDSRFDQYLRGDMTAISANEREGYQLFKKYGCVSCHQGANLGGNFYEKLGIAADYFSHKKTLSPSDYGRFNVTHIEENKFEFKVPGLRNVALTAPYLHDGSAATLPDVIRIMARYQLGITMPEHDVQRIDQFLRTLTGQYQGRPL